MRAQSFRQKIIQETTEHAGDQAPGRRRAALKSGHVAPPAVASRLYLHRQKSLEVFQRGFDDIDYAFPGQKRL